MPQETLRTEVVVVGAGPIGMVIANLLADHDVSVVVLEANSGPADEPRAISIVDESMRTLQSLGLVEEIAADVVWNTGARYLGAKGQPLVEVRPVLSRLGFPQKNFFDQPSLQQALVKAAARRSQVTVVYDATVEAMHDDGDEVGFVVRRPGTTTTVTAAYAVGCDGGRSFVRAAAGIAMTGSSQQEPWIVLDLVDDPHDERMAIFHCDPRRPAVVVPGTQGRCRYELMLLPGESAETVLDHASIRSLVAPYRDTLEPADVRRKAVYVSHQLVAERWRAGRVMIAGDAAHLMPPFAGQGFNTGMRDVRNLAWKLAAVVRGEADAALLDTYDAERRPHAEAMVRLSHQMGKLIMTADPRRARLRDGAFSLARFAPSVKQYFAAMKFVKRAVITQGCVADLGDGSPLVGGLLAQPRVIDATGRQGLLDDFLGRGWSLLAVGRHGPDPFAVLDDTSLAHLRATPVRLLPTDRVPRPGVVPELADLEGFLPAPAEPRFLLVRPDRVVAADFTAGQERRVAARLAPYLPLTVRTASIRKGTTRG